MCNLAEPLHWACEPGRPAADAPAAGPLPQLSAHEARCLLQRIAALREQAQLAVLGADAARDAVPACALQGICQALHEAEAAIAHAQELAARALH